MPAACRSDAAPAPYGLLHGDVLTATGDTLDATLDWGDERRRQAARARLTAGAAVDPNDVIMAPTRRAAPG